MASHYAVLGLERDFTAEQLKKQYRLLALRYHPDRNRGDEAAAADRFKGLQQAHATLSDAAKRANYDYDLRQAADARQRRRVAAPPAPGAASWRADDTRYRGGRAETMDDIFRNFGSGGSAFGGGQQRAPQQPPPSAGSGTSATGDTGRSHGSGAKREQQKPRPASGYHRTPGQDSSSPSTAPGTNAAPSRDHRTKRSERDAPAGREAQREQETAGSPGAAAPAANWWQNLRGRAAEAMSVAAAVAAAATTAPMPSFQVTRRSTATKHTRNQPILFIFCGRPNKKDPFIHTYHTPITQNLFLCAPTTGVGRRDLVQGRGPGHVLTGRVQRGASGDRAKTKLLCQGSTLAGGERRRHRSSRR